MYENHVIFQIGSQLFSLSSLKVKSIENATAVERLVGAPENVLGAAVFRGTLHAIYSLHRKFGIPYQPTKGTQFLYIETGKGIIGIVADAVKEIAMIDMDQKNAVPIIVQNDSTGYVAGIVRHKGELVTIINSEQMIPDSEITAIMKCLNDASEE